MRNYNLGFISDESIYTHVKRTVETYRREITLSQFNHNIVDPIKLTFDSKVYNKTMREAIADECFRQIDKSNSNKIGYFHQYIFRYADAQWTVPKSGFDVENPQKHLFAEIKNKHNTMNSSSSQKTYMKMQNKLLEDDEAVCYLVEVISKDSKDEIWKMMLDGKKCSHKRIRRISIDRFYSIVFGDAEAFVKLCVALPNIIEDVLSDNPQLALSNTVFEELTTEHVDIMAAIYNLAFSKYENFSSLYNSTGE